MRRLLVALLLLGTALQAHASAPATGLLAGAGVVDATWHVGASAGQYASTTDGSDWDPNVQQVKNAPSYGIASRLSIRALVLKSPGKAPVALVKDDNYLSQDMVIRRAAQILAADGSAVTYDHLLVSATHDHNSPYYSTPAAGVWLFEDVFDLRMFEYQARAIAHAVEQGERALRPARVGATTVQFPDFQGNIAGSGVAEDGSPVGYPLMENDHGLTVLRVDGTDGRSIATWVNYAEHGESLEGYDLVSADWLSPFQRYVDRATGAPVVFSQGSVGSAEGPYEHAYAPGKAPVVLDGGEKVSKIYAHLGFAQAERGAHLLASKVLTAWKGLGTHLSSGAVVDMVTGWAPGPVSHPYPSVSNCRTQPAVDGDPGVPVAGLPDCQRASDAFGQSLPADGLFDSLRSAGLPVPSNYDGPSFGAVEENLRLKLQAVRVGDVLLASCACEPQSDIIKALESRTDNVTGNRFNGFDYASAASVAGGWPGLGVRACFAVAAGQSCPDPRDVTGVKRLTVAKDAFAHMQAQINNPADGWEDDPFAGSEPADASKVRGSFTARELSPKCGYRVTVGLGHTGDYNGYTVSYREYMARDSYRKALTSYGPHTADWMVTYLMALASSLKCGTAVPSDTLSALATADEQRQNAEALAIGQLGAHYLDTWDAQIPDNVGPAAAVRQPASISRFNAAEFHWVGGDNWTDNPTVVVQRLVNGRWVFFGNQDGEVQTVLDTPASIAAGAVDNRTGNQKWTWTASFEAFDAGPRADVPGGQTPTGTYRFVVDGRIHLGGAAKPYKLVSRSFAVKPYAGLRGSFKGGRFTTSTAYPRTYASSIRFLGDDLGGVDAGKRDTNGSVLCKTCTFRPWATHATGVSALITVLDAQGSVVRTQRFTSGSFAVALQSGERAVIKPGDLRDSFGETNATLLR